MFNNLEYRVDPSILNEKDKKLRAKKKAIIFEHAIKNMVPTRKLFRYIDGDFENIKTENTTEKNEILVKVLPNLFPKTFSDRVDRILLNLYRTIPNISSNINPRIPNAYFSADENKDESEAMQELLFDMGYLKRSDKGYKISAEGWKRIDTLIKNDNDSKQGFIAMAFVKENDYISSTIKNALNDLGYFGMRIDEKEHNNQIVPEILHEIQRSKFLIMDMTIPNNGAYYEAGYANGLGKPVILCCKKETFDSENRPHFDVIQNSMIIWEDELDLKERLKKRIEATII
jgi:hypothetical protein